LKEKHNATFSQNSVLHDKKHVYSIITVEKKVNFTISASRRRRNCTRWWLV